MRQRTAITRFLGVFALAATFVVGITALMPAKAEAVQCFCSLPVRTVMGWAHGSSCAAAKNACRADARNNAQAACQSIENTSVCQWGSITYRPPNCGVDAGGIYVDFDGAPRIYNQKNPLIESFMAAGPAGLVEEFNRREAERNAG